MSAERLRQAAAKIREVAATEAILRDGDPYYAIETLPDGTEVGEQGAYERLWSPPVALAVADWLDLMAEDYAPYWSEPYAAPFVPVIEKAYRLADLILGGAA